MANFIDTNMNQTVFLDINYLDQLGTDNFDFYLYSLLNTENILDDFLPQYKNKQVGRKAYPPELLLRIIICAYYRGITSSRVIAKLCETDLKFMALAVGTKPHFTTIAHFVGRHSEAIKSLFHRVLLICDASGLIGKEHFAIDGCKLSTDASKELSGKHSELEKHQIIIDTKAFGVGQEQVTLRPMVDSIKKQFDEDVFSNGCVLTADTGYCSEDNLRYLQEEKITAVIPDNKFRLRDPIYADSETFRLHKGKRKKQEPSIRKHGKYFR